MGKSGKSYRDNKRSEKARRAADLANADYLASCGQYDAARALYAAHGIDLVTSADLAMEAR